MRKYRRTTPKKQAVSRAARGHRTISTAPPQLIVYVGESLIASDVVSDIDDAFIEKLSKKCQAASGTITVDLTEISRWADAPQWRILQFFRSLGDRLVVRSGKKEYDDVFRAVLAAMVGTDDLTAHRNSVRAAIEAAALFHGHTVAAVAGMIHLRLRELGAQPERREAIAKEIRALTGSGGVAENIAADTHRLAAEFVRASGGTNVDDGNPTLLYYRSDIWNL